MYEAFIDSIQAFEAAGLPEPLQETLRLFDILSKGAISRASQTLSASTELNLNEYAAKRHHGMPAEYIIGRTTFMGLEFYCTPATLIPRAETELLVNKTLEIARQILTQQRKITIIDMGTGSGNIAVSLAKFLPQANIFACDISETAVEMARLHVDKHGVSDQVTICCGDLFTPLENFNIGGKIDLVVCNPPYIPSKSLTKMASEIVDYEPRVALDAGAYGIDVFRRLISEAHDYLRPGGFLAFEIGTNQDRLVMRLLKKNGKYEHLTKSYLNGVVRVISARKTENLKLM